jgi:F-type H+-transporting ATPase subunit delta
MTGAAGVYGQGLYALAKEESLEEAIFQELSLLQTAFAEQPDFLKLLASSNVPKQERLDIIDNSFRGKTQPYVLNFLKLLTEKGYIVHFAACCEAYRQQYNADKGILQVRAVSALPLTDRQKMQLTDKLATITGKKIDLVCKVDKSVLGGIRLNYGGIQVDGTVQSRLQALEKAFKNTVLG